MTDNTATPTRNFTNAPRLTPEERLALMVAWAQLTRGEIPTQNVSVVCVAALYRITQGGAS